MLAQNIPISYQQRQMGVSFLSWVCTQGWYNLVKTVWATPQIIRTSCAMSEMREIHILSVFLFLKNKKKIILAIQPISLHFVHS